MSDYAGQSLLPLFLQSKAAAAPASSTSAASASSSSSASSSASTMGPVSAFVSRFLTQVGDPE